MRKNILSGIAFFAILAVLLAAASHLLQPKNNTNKAGMMNPPADGILAEPENSIDVLILGNSQSYCSFIPMEIWKEQGITSYVCGVPLQMMYQSEGYLRRAFRTQSPKIVILETLTIFAEYSRTEALPEKAAEWIPLLRYHDRWKSLRAEDWYKPVKYSHVRGDKGFRAFHGAKAADTMDYMKPSEEVHAISPINIRHVRKIQAFCQKHGAQLILVSAPSTVNWNQIMSNGIAAMADRLGIPYLDLNLMPEEVPIDWEKDSFDGGDHLNVNGAKKVSAFMGKWLAETGLFEDKRTWEAYSQWNQFLQEYLEDKEVDRTDFDK